MNTTQTERTDERELSGPGRCSARQMFAEAEHAFRCRGGFAHSKDHSYEADDAGFRRVFSREHARGRRR